MLRIQSILQDLKPEHEFGDDTPADLLSLVNTVANLGLKSDILAPWYGAHLMDRFISQWRDEREEGHSPQNVFPKSVFDQVGIAFKYIFAWDSLSLGLFDNLPIAHELILETTNDLQCSAYLSSEKFFKQSLQMLRNYCESCVGIIYFQKNTASFKAWREDLQQYHFPDYREMVNSLTEKGVLSSDENRTLHKRYSELNNSVHNKRNRLNMNFRKLHDEIASFGTSDYIEWSKEIKRTVMFMMGLYVRLWEANYWR